MKSIINSVAEEAFLSGQNPLTSYSYNSGEHGEIFKLLQTPSKLFQTLSVLVQTLSKCVQTRPNASKIVQIIMVFFFNVLGKFPPKIYFYLKVQEIK